MITDSTYDSSITSKRFKELFALEVDSDGKILSFPFYYLLGHTVTYYYQYDEIYSVWEKDAADYAKWKENNLHKHGTSTAEIIQFQQTLLR